MVTSDSRRVPGTPMTSIGSSSVLEKRVPRNNKFSTVRSTIDTGKHINNMKEKKDHSGELFKRISNRQLELLFSMSEASEENIYNVQASWNSENLEDYNSKFNSLDTQSTISNYSAKSSTSSIASAQSSAQRTAGRATATPAAGASTFSIFQQHDEIKQQSQSNAASDEENQHFLLLDLREEDEYKQAHIQGAISYPAALLRRDFFIPQIYKFRNSPNKIIVVYDSDDSKRIGLEAANLFVQKNYNNIFYLSGGLKKMAEKHPHRIIGTNSARNHLLSSSSSSSSVVSSVAPSRNTSARSVNTLTLTSTRSNASLASQNITNTPSTRSHITAHQSTQDKPVVSNQFVPATATGTSLTRISSPTSSQSSAYSSISSTSSYAPSQANSRYDQQQSGRESPRAALALQQQRLSSSSSSQRLKSGSSTRGTPVSNKPFR